MPEYAGVRPRTSALGNSTSLLTDKCGQDVLEQQSVDPGNYMLTNYYGMCNTNKQMDLALRERGSLVKNGFGHAMGCNIDNDSYMRNEVITTNPRMQHQLFLRPYLTVPYLGRGNGEPDTESFLRSGFQTDMSKACDVLADRSIIPERMAYTRYWCPQDNVVEDFPFPRSGQDSRQDIRRSKYAQRCVTRPNI